MEDVTERTATVPQNPNSGLWYYDYSCPEGTFITRFFGKAGTYINTLTAQCGSVWNLKAVGINEYAQGTDLPYSHTSVDGYSGIAVKSYSGSVDCIQFINATGGRSTAVGNPTAGGNWTDLRCMDESRVSCIFGWQDAFMSSIGIICSPGTGIMPVGNPALPCHIRCMPLCC